MGSGHASELLKQAYHGVPESRNRIHLTHTHTHQLTMFSANRSEKVVEVLKLFLSGEQTVIVISIGRLHPSDLIACNLCTF